MAGGNGIEPLPTGPKPVGLPLHQPPIKKEGPRPVLVNGAGDDSSANTHLPNLQKQYTIGKATTVLLLYTSVCNLI